MKIYFNQSFICFGNETIKENSFKNKFLNHNNRIIQKKFEQFKLKCDRKIGREKTSIYFLTKDSKKL